MHIVHAGVHTVGHYNIGHFKQRIQAGNICRSGAERHECVHIRRAVQNTLCAVYKEFAVYHHDCGGKQQLDNTNGNMVLREPFWQRPVPHSMTH